ncbi:MAG: hypothetical protein IJ413_08125 [Bacteroides sp.]|nr:hypothetical protein [Bacteroides sp.]
MKLKDQYINGSTLPEEYALPAIIELGVIKRIPIFVFSSGTAVQFMNKLIPLHTQTNKEKLKEGNLNPKEWKHFDENMKDVYDAPVWVYDIEAKSIEDYKSAEEVIVNEKIEYVFIDSLSETIDKLEIIKWSEEVGFNVYFTKFTFK